LAAQEKIFTATSLKAVQLQGLIAVFYRFSSGLVLDLFWICFGFVLDLFWICFGFVRDLAIIQQQISNKSRTKGEGKTKERRRKELIECCMSWSLGK